MVETNTKEMTEEEFGRKYYLLGMINMVDNFRKHRLTDEELKQVRANLYWNLHLERLEKQTIH